MAEFMKGSVRLDELLRLPDDELKFVVRDCSSTSTTSTYSPIVYLSRHLMTRHEISYREPKVLRGSGGRQTPCIVIPDLQEETRDENFVYEIRLNSVVQDRLAVVVGESVTMLNSERICDGKIVWIRPVCPVQASFVDLEMENLMETYLLPYFWRAYRMLCEGDVFEVARCGKMITFQVTNTDPSPFCVVAPGTTIQCEGFVPEMENSANDGHSSPIKESPPELVLIPMPKTITKRKPNSTGKRRQGIITRNRNIRPSSTSAVDHRTVTQSDRPARDTEDKTSSQIHVLPTAVHARKQTKPLPDLVPIPVAVQKLGSWSVNTRATTKKGIGSGAVTTKQMTFDDNSGLINTVDDCIPVTKSTRNSKAETVAKEGAKAKKSGVRKKRKLSPKLANVMGQEYMFYHEVVRRIWKIIREKNLYDPNNKQFALCNEELLPVFGVKRFRTFGMMKYLKKHHFLD